MSADWQVCDQFGIAPGFATDGRYVSITKEMCAELVEASAGLKAVLGFEDRFSSIIDNFVEIETAILRLSVLHSVRAPHVIRNGAAHRRNIDRLLLNLLAACRQYLDQNGRLIEPLLEGTGTSFKLEASKCFDRSLHYRFMEGFRNHVQHKDTGVHTIIFTAGSAPNSAGLRHTFSLTVDPEALREPDAVRSAVIDELLLQTHAPDLMQSVRGYLSCLASMHRATRVGLDRRIDKWRDAISAGSVKFQEEFPALGLSGFALMAYPAEQSAIRIAFVNGEAITRLDDARLLNACPIELERSFVSSESIPRKWSSQ